MQSRGDASSEAFAPFCSTCSVASRRNVTSSTRAISTVSELRMAPRTASPLNFCARSFQRMENGSVRSGQLARFEIFTDHERPLAFSLSLFDLLSPPSRVSFSLSLCPFHPDTRRIGQEICCLVNELTAVSNVVAR